MELRAAVRADLLCTACRCTAPKSSYADTRERRGHSSSSEGEDSAAVTVSTVPAATPRLRAAASSASSTMIEELARGQGEATVHPSNLLHAVTAMQSGVRYSAILFFHHDEQVADGSDSKKIVENPVERDVKPDGSSNG